MLCSKMSGDRVPVGGDNAAEDAVSTVLVKEGKDAAVGKAESSDEKHGCFTSTAGDWAMRRLGRWSRSCGCPTRASPHWLLPSSARSAIMKNTRVKLPTPPTTSDKREDAPVRSSSWNLLYWCCPEHR